jgi:hypothetical protein
VLIQGTISRSSQILTDQRKLQDMIFNFSSINQVIRAAISKIDFSKDSIHRIPMVEGNRNAGIFENTEEENYCVDSVFSSA